MKKILSFLTALTLVFGAGSALPEGALKLDTDISASAEKYGDFEYTIWNGVVDITKYTGSDTEVTIPSTIDGIERMFIDDGAFANCTSLTRVTIPGSVTSIWNGAFHDCTSLESVTISDGVKSIGDEAFYNCTSLTSITIPDSVTSIGDRAFDLCDSLKSVTIPNSVTSIGSYAFGYTNYVYDNDAPIKNFVIYGDYGTAAETYAKDNGIIFNLCTSGDWNYSKLDDGTVEINEYTGSDTEVTIPSTIDGKKVTRIGKYAFDSCTSLASVTIPDSVTSIGYRAFFGCTSLKSVTIPNSVTSIGFYAFGSVSHTKIDDFTIYGYSGTAAETYAKDEYFDFVDLGMEYTYGDWTYKMLADGTAVIEEYKGSDTKVTIPAEIDGKKVTSIGDYTFWKCTSLTSITIPNSVTSIGEGAFGLCTSLTSISIPNSVTNINEGAFYNCTSLTSITIPDSVTTIGVSAFGDCTNLKSITIPNSVTSIGEGAFGGCKSLKSITIPDSITSIGVSAFWNCTNLKSVTIPDSVTSIDEIAFEDCTSLKSITIPNSVTSIGDRALGYDSKENKIDGFTIYGYSGTAAETYANDNGFDFVDLDEIKKGDVNNDTDINMKDLTRLQQYLAEWEVYVNENAADVTGDKKVDMKDLTRLQQYLAKWEVTLG